MKDAFYVTTPIYYVNDVPHIGHAYTTIAADVLARYHRARGRRAFFLTGTDEHGQKVQQAAAQRNVPPQQHCDEMVLRFQELWRRLHVAPDRFIRTTDQDHVSLVQQALQKLYGQGLIVRRTYEGWYSTSSERFWTAKDLVDGKDPDSGLPVEWLSESNYFFLMSQYQQRLIEHLRQNPASVRPASRYNEVLGFLEKPLDDLCISRPKSRLAWGIELPFDRDYVTYVWFDALLNYLTGIGFGAGGGQFANLWPANFHLVGKDILTTHAVYWPCMLFALGVPPVRHLFAHGWWTVEGRKMSKSLHNVVNPLRLIDTYGPDVVRYFLLREVPFGLDGDFSHAAIIGRINADLGNDLGNALNRALAMCEKFVGPAVPQPGEATAEDQALIELARKTREALALDLDEGDYRGDAAKAGELGFSRALETLWVLVRAINKYLDTQAPWALAKENKLERNRTVLYAALEAIRHVAVMLAPFMPEKTREIMAALGYDGLGRPGAPEIPAAFLFAALERWGGLPPGQILRRGPVVFPRVEPEHVEAVLKEILALAADEKEALASLKRVFPRLPPADCRKWLAKLYQPAGAPGAEQRAPAAEPAKKKKRELPPPAEKITFDEFCRLDLRVAEVLACERVPGSDKLLKLTVNAGDLRTLVAGIGEAYQPEDLVGQKVSVVANLEPATLLGIESRGMILAAGPGGKEIQVAFFPASAVPGARIK